ncbi:MAG: hypothetical protein IMX00_09785 [Limnochordales bacterium]|nr:hypothetical protein [Limnochordales bacterium]
MPTPIIQLFAPEVVQVARAVPDSITVGDLARVRLHPGIFDLLMNPVAGSQVPLGKDLHPMTTIPVGIAIDAATEACGHSQTGVGVLRALEISMEAPVSMNLPLEAVARVTEIGARHATVAVEVVELAEPSVRLILRGKAVLVKVVGGKAAPVPVRAEAGAAGGSS